MILVSVAAELRRRNHHGGFGNSTIANQDQDGSFGDEIEAIETHKTLKSRGFVASRCGCCPLRCID